MLQILLSMLDTDEERTLFEQFYYKYRKLMLYTAYNILNDSGLAEHAVQEAFIRCAKNFHKIDDIFCPRARAFAVIITKNESLRILKSEKREAPAANEEEKELNDSIGHADESAEDAALGRLTARELSLLIEKLDDKYKNVLYLRYFNGFSMAETADALGITAEAAKKRAQRAVKKLQKMINMDHMNGMK